MKDEDLLVCMPVKLTSGESVAQDSVIRKCFDCDGDIYIAPSGQRLLATKKIKTVCVLCCAIRVQSLEEKPTVVRAPGSTTELLKHGVDPLVVKTIEAQIPEIEADDAQDG